MSLLLFSRLELDRSCQLERSTTRPRTGWVAGINHGGHDASCALLHEGHLVVMVEQERLSRVKRAVEQSPAESLAACLRFAGISLHELDIISLGSEHERLLQWMGDDRVRSEEVRKYSSQEWLLPCSLFGDLPSPPIEAVPHHKAHAASAFYASGQDESAALIMDAMGEDTSTTIAGCKENQIELLKTYSVDQSLGYFYETATEFAGFSRNDAGKLMGLAAYGEPIYPIPLTPPRADGESLWDLPGEDRFFGTRRVADRCRRLSEAFCQAAFPFEGGIEGEPMAYRDFAASAQTAVERVVLALVEQTVALTGCRNLVLAGGVAMNCAANGKIAASGLVDNFFVQPVSTDAGVALGAALDASIRLYGEAHRPARMRHAYWGLAEPLRTIEDELRDAGLEFQQVSRENLVESVAAAIHERKVVAWHQGRGEVGPRALGARSLLGDPRTRETVVAMNAIKGREVWRPLAPSVSAEDFGEYFQGLPNPFMIVAVTVRPHAVRRIPAVVHVDGSARPQAVDEADNPLFHRLLKAFQGLSGVPILVNTSLNGKGEPICYRARDTIRFFKRSSIHILAIENFIVRKAIDGK